MKRFAKTALPWWKLAGLLLIPVILAVTLMGAVNRADPKEIDAAVVNHDEAVEIDGQILPMGRQLAAAMVDRGEDNISWTLADESNAMSGLQSGKYSVAVIIPQNFSAAATSFSKNDADQAEQATIQVLVSENIAVTDAQLAAQIARIAQSSINTQLTEGYLDNIYLGFNKFGESMVTLSEGVHQLHDGSVQLDDGVKQAGEGTRLLADGLGQMQNGAVELRKAGDQLVAGGSKLSGAGSQLRSGGKELIAGAEQYSAGTKQFADGINQLADQMPQLVSGVAQLNDGARQFADQLPQYTAGVSELYDGFSQLAGMVNEIADFLRLDQITPEQIAKFKQISGEITRVLDDIAKGMQQAEAHLDGLIAQPPKLPADRAQKIAKRAVDCSQLTPEQCTLAREQFIAGLQTGYQQGIVLASQQAKALLHFTDPNTGKELQVLLAEFGQRTEAILAEINAMIDQVPDDIAGELVRLEQGVKQAKQLVTAGDQLNQGANQLAGGISQLNSEVGKLPDGVNQLTDGANRLNQGANDLTSGIRKYVGGVGQYTDGVGEYTSGVKQYVGGVNQLLDGVDQSVNGAVQLADGMVELGSGSAQLSAGLGTLSEEIDKGAKEIPSYSQQDREKLAQVVTRPIDGDDSLVRTSLIGSITLLATIMLWLGAVISYILLRPIPQRVLTSSRPTWQLAGYAMLPAAIIAWIQAGVLGPIAAWILRLPFTKGVAFTFLLLFMATCFVAVNHALAALWGWSGRALALAMGLLTLVIGISTALPGWFEALAIFSPATSGLHAARTLASSGDGLTGQVGTLVAWLVVASLAGTWAVLSKRQLNVRQYVAQLKAKPTPANT